jgi:ATP-dependent DNA helicase RecG
MARIKKQDKLSRSPRVNAALALMGIWTPEDAVAHLPRRYESYIYTKKKTVYEDKDRLVLLGELVGAVKLVRFGSRSLASFYFKDEEGETFLVNGWNRTYLAKILKKGEKYSLIGIYDGRRHSLNLVNILKGRIPPEEALRPVYTLPDSVSNHTFVSIVRKSLNALEGQKLSDVPLRFQEKYRLADHLDALRMAHFPKSDKDIHDGLRVLKYEEAFDFELRTAFVRGANKGLRKQGERKIDRKRLDDFILTLPYSLSDDQRKATEECLNDMDSESAMYRLLQGDVGTGKTLVAALLAYANFTRGCQTALMAPTDSLARQHYDKLKSLFECTGLRVGLLVGGISTEERRLVYESLADGTISLVVGTHALFSKGVNYLNLGLAIIDEQHKFGVNQRTTLLGKGEKADLLLMSATPIPRTLALTIYGDMDVSSLYTFPAGKRDVKTVKWDSSDERILRAVHKCLDTGHRAYIVVPKIEGDSEETSVKKTYEMYHSIFGDKAVMMHGRLEEEEKLDAIAKFRSGECPIMVATSLIEVGIDVKEANLMVIYSPSHFALSSLHQLRGRIGRDGSRALCILASSGEEGEEKLGILLETDDGFKIAEEDMRLRGPGEIAGTKQSGLPDFKIANIVDDYKIFECARDDAAYVYAHAEDPEFKELAERTRKAVRDEAIA